MIFTGGWILLLCSLAAQAHYFRPESSLYSYGGYRPHVGYGGYIPYVGYGGYRGHVGYGGYEGYDRVGYGYDALNSWAPYGGYPGYGAYSSVYGRYPHYRGYSAYGGYSGHQGGHVGHKSSANGARYKRGTDQKYELKPMKSGVVNPFGENSVGLSLSPWYAYSTSAYQDYKHDAVKHSMNRYAPERVHGSEGREKICLVLYVNRPQEDPDKSSRGFVDIVRKFIRLEGNVQLDNVLQNPGHAFEQFGLDFSQGGGVAACRSPPVVCWSNVEFLLVFPDFRKIKITPSQGEYINEGCVAYDDARFTSFLCAQQIATQAGSDNSVTPKTSDLSLPARENGFSNDLLTFLRHVLLPSIVEGSNQPIRRVTSEGLEIVIQVYLTFGGGDEQCTTRLFVETSDFNGHRFTVTERNRVFTVPLEPSVDAYLPEEFEIGQSENLGF